VPLALLPQYVVSLRNLKFLSTSEDDAVTLIKGDPSTAASYAAWIVVAAWQLNRL
jgi:hypothetical protein